MSFWDAGARRPQIVRNIEVPACHPEAGNIRESEATPVSQEGWKYKVSPLECHSGADMPGLPSGPLVSPLLCLTFHRYQRLLPH